MKLEEQNKIRSVINDLENKLNLLILSKYSLQYTTTFVDNFSEAFSES